MKMNNTYFSTFTIGLLAWILSSGNTAMAQDRKKQDSKIHLQITQEIDGRKVHIDTTFDASQKEAVMAHLRSMGIDISEPAPPSRPRSPLPPPPPPAAPGMPAPPEPPGDPDPGMKEWSFRFKHELTEEEQKELDEELKNIDKEIRNIRIITIPDLHELDDINISIDGHMLSEKDKEEFKKEMDKLKEDLKQLNEKLKDLKIEIRDHSDDIDDKEGSFRVNDDDFNYVYTYTTTKSRDKDKEKGKNKAKGKDVNATAFHVFPNPGDGVINLELNLDDNSPVQITITDANGKVVYEERQEKVKGKLEKKIDISDKGKGMYMITVTQGDNRMQTKVVVK